MLYSRPAAELIQRLQTHTIDVDSDSWARDLTLSTLVCQVAAKLYDDEAARKDAMKPHLGELFGISFSPPSPPGGIPIQPQGVAFDAVVTIIVADGRTIAILCAVEYKNELGPSGMAHLQAPFTFQRLTSHPAVVLSNPSPTILIVIAGPDLAINYGIFADTWMFKEIIRIRLTGNTVAERRANIERLALVAREVRQTVAELRTLYAGVRVSPPTPNLVPYLPDPTPLPTDPFPRLQFTDRLSSDLSASLFRAELVENKVPVIVKFCNSYDANAHNALADGGFAPHLHGRRTFPLTGGLTMVIMHTERTSDLISAKAKYQRLPKPVKTEVMNALKVLHDAGYVHGDIRRENILVPRDHHGPIMLVGLGSAGRVEQARYPPDLVLDTLRCKLKGAQAGGKITRKHDIEMCKQL
ncbi:hypothetical protein LXA43DRAFT_884996 [Ganoderma leucocontextum]|nr:hypothetical protein LXA43DRAFT_884996 [Ganoderma leucocontextum]